MWAATRRLTSCFQAGHKFTVLADLLKAQSSFRGGEFQLPAHDASSAPKMGTREE
jgi:hypothetical protein